MSGRVSSNLEKIAVLVFLRNPVIARPGPFFFTVLRENCVR
jgi:hypothetical protein